MATQRKRGGKGGVRSELVAIRFDPRTKFLLEMAARAQHRSASNFIEEAVEQAIQNVMVRLPNGTEAAMRTLQHFIWDPLEPDRFFRLAGHAPYLLTYDEQKLWKLVQETFRAYDPSITFKEGGEPILRPEQFELMRKHWDMLKDAAESGQPASEVAKALGGDEKAQLSITVGSSFTQALRDRDDPEKTTPAQRKARAAALKKASEE